MLRGQIALVMIATGLLYIFIDIIYDIYRNIPMYSSVFVVGVITFWLNRKKLYRTSTVVFILFANFIVYLFAASEPPASGVYIFFLPICLAAMTLFSYTDWYWVIASFILSLSLFLFAFLTDFSILPVISGFDETDEVYFLINFVLAVTVSVLIVYFLININHHTEKVLMDNEKRLLLLTDELKKSNAELDRFVYSVSHDLRAPLSSVLGLVGIAEKTDGSDEMKTYLKMMRERIDALEKFIKDIIDYSRNARLDIEVEDIDLKALVLEVMDSLRFADEFSSVEIKSKIPDGFYIKCDRLRLKVVLNNLVANALKYHDQLKDKKLLEIQAYHENGKYKIIVKDNGVGIHGDQLPKVFDMFYRASENSKGSGLGLYIAQETIKKMKGKISVESELSVGSAFQIELPST